MQRFTLLASAFVLLACTSAAPNAHLVQPEIEFFQLVGPADLNYPAGEIEVQFGVRIANRSAEPIKLRQIEMTPVGSGGPYRVRRRIYFFNEEVAPNGSRDVAFWARADARGDALAIDASAPISVRAVAWFESPAGNFRKIVMKTFGQHGTGPRG